MEKSDRGFEILLAVVALVGLLILFTLLFAGPGYIYHTVLEYFQS